MIERFQFDPSASGGMLSDPPSLQFPFVRPYATITPGGVASPINTPRFWHHTRLLCGAPTVKTERTNDFFIVHSGGVNFDGVTPMFAYQPAGPGFLLVHKTSLALPPILQTPIAFTFQQRFHEIQSVHVCFGLVVCFAQVGDGNPAVFASSSAWTWQEGDPSLSLNFLDTNTQPGFQRGSDFQSQGFRILDVDANSGQPLEMWIAWADYVRNGFNGQVSQGGRYYVMRAKRLSVNQRWSVDPVQIVCELPVGNLGPGGRHAHPPYVERFGAAGLRVVCPVGDAFGNNGIFAITRIDANYAQGEAGKTDGAVQNGWTTRYVHGIKAASGPVGEGNQFVASAPHGYPAVPTGQIVGGDEVPHGINLLAPLGNSTTNKAMITRLYGPTAAGINRNYFNSAYVFNCFRIACADPLVGGPFVAQIAPGNQTDWSNRNAASRVVYSPDGTLWGQCFAYANAPIIPVVFFGDKIIMGSSGGAGFSRELRSIPIPTVQAQRPLVLCNGGTNRLDIGNPVAVTAPNTVTQLQPSDFQSLGVPNPPCFGSAFRVTSPNQSNIQNLLGIWRVTKDSPNDLLNQNSKIKVRFWIYPLPWNGTTRPLATGTPFYAAIGQYAGAGIDPKASMSNSREQVSFNYAESCDAVRGWLAVTIDTDPQALVGPKPRWNNDAGTLNLPQDRPAAPFPLGVRLLSRIGSQPANPCDFLLAFDCVIAEPTFQDYPSAALPLNTSASSEQAAVIGFNCANNWTIELAGEVPDHCWDMTDVNRPQNKVLCTLFESATSWLTMTHEGGKVYLRTSSSQFIGVEAGNYQSFEPLRGSPVLLAVSCTKTSSVAKYRFSVSIGGSEVFSAQLSEAQFVKPTEIRFGDHNKENIEAMLWYAGRIHDNEARTEAQMAQALINLEMIVAGSIPIPPGVSAL